VAKIRGDSGAGAFHFLKSGGILLVEGLRKKPGDLGFKQSCLHANNRNPPSLPPGSSRASGGESEGGWPPPTDDGGPPADAATGPAGSRHFSPPSLTGRRGPIKTSHHRGTETTEQKTVGTRPSQRLAQGTFSILRRHLFPSMGFCLSLYDWSAEGLAGARGPPANSVGGRAPSYIRPSSDVFL
jgi:hypothetical protein